MSCPAPEGCPLSDSPDAAPGPPPAPPVPSITQTLSRQMNDGPGFAVGHPVTPPPPPPPPMPPALLPDGAIDASCHAPSTHVQLGPGDVSLHVLSSSLPVAPDVEPGAPADVLLAGRGGGASARPLVLGEAAGGSASASWTTTWGGEEATASQRPARTAPATRMSVSARPASCLARLRVGSVAAGRSGKNDTPFLQHRRACGVAASGEWSARCSPCRRAPGRGPGNREVVPPVQLSGSSSRTGRTSMLPSRAGGIRAAIWIASFRSRASTR